MAGKQEKKAPNFWYEGNTLLHDLPEIGAGVKHLVKHDPQMKAAYAGIGKLQWKKQPDGFEGLVCIILGQQVSVAAAAHMAARLREKLPKMTPDGFLKLGNEELRAIGFSRQKVTYCRDIAERIVAGEFDPAALSVMDDKEAFDALLELKGIGFWSAEIYLMFCLGRGDVWPAGDLGLQNGIQRFLKLKKRPDEEETRELGEKWAPYRSAAALIVWQALKVV